MGIFKRLFSQDKGKSAPHKYQDILTWISQVTRDLLSYLSNNNVSEIIRSMPFQPIRILIIHGVRLKAN